MDTRRTLAISILANLAVPNLRIAEDYRKEGTAYDDPDIFSPTHSAKRATANEFIRHEQRLESFVDDRVSLYDDFLDFDEDDPHAPALAPYKMPGTDAICRKAISDLAETLDELTVALRRMVVYAATYEEPRLTQSELADHARVSHTTIGRWIENSDDATFVRRTVHENAIDVARQTRTADPHATASLAWVEKQARRCADDGKEIKRGGELAYITVYLDWSLTSINCGGLSNASIHSAIDAWTNATDEESCGFLSYLHGPLGTDMVVAMVLASDSCERLTTVAKRRGLSIDDAVNHAIVAQLAKEELAGSPLLGFSEK